MDKQVVDLLIRFIDIYLSISSENISTVVPDTFLRDFFFLIWNQLLATGRIHCYSAKDSKSGHKNLHVLMGPKAKGALFVLHNLVRDILKL